jgi:hypothetical protein
VSLPFVLPGHAEHTFGPALVSALLLLWQLGDLVLMGSRLSGSEVQQFPEEQRRSKGRVCMCEHSPQHNTMCEHTQHTALWHACSLTAWHLLCFIAAAAVVVG